MMNVPKQNLYHLQRFFFFFFFTMFSSITLIWCTVSHLNLIFDLHLKVGLFSLLLVSFACFTRWRRQSLVLIQYMATHAPVRLWPFLSTRACEKWQDSSLINKHTNQYIVTENNSWICLYLLLKCHNTVSQNEIKPTVTRNCFWPTSINLARVWC